MSSSLEHGEVVVSDQAELASLRDQRGALVGLGAVADDVAEAPDVLDLGIGDVVEHRLERRQVGVDVGEDARRRSGGLS